MRQANQVSFHFVAWLLLATSSALAQQFDELSGGHLPAWRGDVGALALADVDNDGDLDLVLPVRGGPNRLWQNDGNGVFTDVTASHMPPGTDHARAVAIADIDGDGDQDLAFANLGWQGRNRLYRNTGGGVFEDVTASHLPHQDFPSAALLFVDVDTDGDADLLFTDPGSGPSRHRMFRNDGSGSFHDDSMASMPLLAPQSYAKQLAAADIDGDGDQDLVSAGFATRLYTNNGAGVFTDVTSTRLPASTDAEAVAFGDVDGDGDADLVLARSAQNRLYRNLGNGTFVDATTAAMAVDTAAEFAIVLRDCDGDGDPDLVTAGLGIDRYYRNVGGVFVDTMAQQVPWHDDESRGLAAGDVDGDGDVDLVYGNWSPPSCRLVLNDGSAHFRDAVLVHLPRRLDGATEHTALADFDGDGDTDGFAVDSQRRGWLLRNDGSGTFAAALVFDLAGVVDYVQALAFADVDGDGDRDLVLATNSTIHGRVRLYRNSGNGNFHDVTAAVMPAVTPYLTGLVTGDFDQDGDVDIVGSAQQQRLYLENSPAGWIDRTATNLPLVSGPATAIASGDLDGDGDLDLVLGIPGQSSRLWTNQGNGAFIDTTGGQSLAATAGTTRVLPCDVDGDQDLDLLFACNTGFGSGQEQLYRNDGGGVFTDVTSAQLPAANDDTGPAAAGDLDGDGDVDLVLGRYVVYPTLQGTHRVLRNDGSGSFTDVTAAWSKPTGTWTYTVALADVDEDGDLDVWLGAPNGDTLWFNMQRHLNAPLLLRPGRPWPLVAHARGGQPGTADVVWPWLSLTRTAIAVPPFGVLGIDPVAALSPIVVPQPAGIASTAWPVPNTPALAGLLVCAQAVHLPASGPIHLTNVVHDLLRR